MFRTLIGLLRPVLDAFFQPGIRWEHRWRLLLLQQISILTYSLTALPWIFSKSYTVYWIPTKEGRSVRTIVFQPRKRQAGRLHPLHLDIHGGSFLGGVPEQDAWFISRLPEKTGAVVISTQYRYAPVHQFPAAIDDIDDVVRFLHQNAEQLWGADPNLMTVSGFSVGGNLALAACQQPACHLPASTAFKASVTFYAAVDLRSSPWEKPKPLNFPKKDPLVFLMPLFDAYASEARAANIDNPRFAPMVSDIDVLPEDMLLIIAAIDILSHEQLTFTERVKEDIAKRGLADKRSVETKLFDKGFHGWLELPFGAFQADRNSVLDTASEFLRKTHKKYDWHWE